VYGGDHRLRAVFYRKKERQKALAFFLAGGDPAELLYIGPGYKGAASAYQDGGLDFGICGYLIDCRSYPFGHAGAERIDGRVVDGNDGNVAVPR
jgi:hypothetical protein